MRKAIYIAYVLGSLAVAATILIVSVYVQAKKDKQRYSGSYATGEETQVATESGEQIHHQVESSSIQYVKEHGPTNTTEQTASERPELRQGTVDEREEIERYIEEIFEDPQAINWATVVAWCESTYNPLAENPAGYFGLFQYHPDTYSGCGGTDIWDWREQVRITKSCMYDGGRQGEFPVCNRKVVSQYETSS